MNDKKHQDLLLSIAQDFYLNKLSVSDLSAKYNVSRYYISKYLDEVVENNLVTIHINTPFARNAKMERTARFLASYIKDDDGVFPEKRLHHEGKAR